MTQLAELARLIRSKNAGPFELTFDIMFEDAATYERVKRSGAVSREAIATRYNLPANEVVSTVGVEQRHIQRPCYNRVGRHFFFLFVIVATTAG